MRSFNASSPRRTAVVICALLLFASLATAAQAAPCPPEMVLVDDFCIDRWEAHIEGHSPYVTPVSGTAASAVGTVPQGYISGVVAASACQSAGKRLCTSAEWLRACMGPASTTYPYGNTYVAGACNDTRAVHPIIELYGTFDPTKLNDPALNQLPDTVDPTGANTQCVTAEGVHDMHGNLNEWVSDASGTFRGGYYVEAHINGAGCGYATTAHNTLHHDFTTGFRCCVDPGNFPPALPMTSPVGSVWLAVALICASGAVLSLRAVR